MRLLTATFICLLSCVATSTIAGEKSKSPSPATPVAVSYTVVDSSIVPGIKRSLVVRLNKKISENALRAIALKLKSQETQDYQRTFITYYLPGMKIDAGAWATTHFNPNLEVLILGVAVEEEKQLANGLTQDGREIVGSWIDETPGVAGRITIFREARKLYIETRFKDGSNLKEELIEKKSGERRRFDKLEGSEFGDHWIIDSNGNLQVRDNEGLIRTALKAK